jgi:hypothetical protein
MFDVKSIYPFENRGSAQSLESYPYIRHTYAFLNREGHTYIVWIDEFEDCHLYGVKYFRSDYRESIDQFGVILNTNDYKRVISTVLEIMVCVHKANPIASFIFQGANSNDEGEMNTQRYRVWGLIARSVFPKDNFDFYPYIEKSVFLVRNRACTKPILAEIDDILKHYGVIF